MRPLQAFHSLLDLLLLPFSSSVDFILLASTTPYRRCLSASLTRPAPPCASYFLLFPPGPLCLLSLHAHSLPVLRLARLLALRFDGLRWPLVAYQFPACTNAGLAGLGLAAKAAAMLSLTSFSCSFHPPHGVPSPFVLLSRLRTAGVGSKLSCQSVSTFEGPRLPDFSPHLASCPAIACCYQGFKAPPFAPHSSRRSSFHGVAANSFLSVLLDTGLPLEPLSRD